MRAFPHIIEDKFYEGQSPALLARVTDATGEEADTDSFASASYTIYEFEGDQLAIGSLTPGDVLYDALQTDDRWRNEDQTGYNFLWQVPASLFTLAGKKTYWIEILLTDSAGAKTPILAKLYQYPLRSV